MNRSWPVLRLCIFLILASTLASCANNPQIDSSLDGKLVDRIAYFSDTNQGTQIFLMTPDGKDLPAIQFALPAGIRFSNIKWSKNAQLWIFSGVGSGPTDIYTASADGKTIKNITNFSGSMTADDPVISPDGKRVAYVMGEGGQNTAVATSLIDGTGISRVSKTAVMETSPAWLPDSSHLLMFSSEQGSPNIYKASVDGSPLVNLSKGPGLDSDYSLSENGAMTVFISDRARGKNLFAYEMSSGKITQLTKDLGNIYSPKISPDASKVVFRAEKDGASDLYLYNFKDQSTAQLTHTPQARQQDIIWSADGQKILFAADEKGQKDIFSMDLTGKITNLTNRPSNEYGPMWVRMLP